MASTRPVWSSEMTSCVPERPLATRERKKASQPAPSSDVAMSTPRISRCPPPLTPVATRQATLTIRPPSRTFIVKASAHT